MKYIVKIIASQKEKTFETKKEAHDYAMKVMQKTGKSISIKEVKN